MQKGDAVYGICTKRCREDKENSKEELNVKLRTGLVENYDAVYVERKNQNCLWLKGFIREKSKIQIKKYRFLSDIIDA